MSILKLDTHGTGTGGGTTPVAERGVARRRFVLTAAAFVGLAGTAGCSATGGAMCSAESRGGRKRRVMARVPCLDEAG